MVWLSACRKLTNLLLWSIMRRSRRWIKMEFKEKSWEEIHSQQSIGAALPESTGKIWRGICVKSVLAGNWGLEASGSLWGRVGGVLKGRPRNSRGESYIEALPTPVNTGTNIYKKAFRLHCTTEDQQHLVHHSKEPPTHRNKETIVAKPLGSEIIVAYISKIWAIVVKSLRPIDITAHIVTKHLLSATSSRSQ